MDIADNNDHYQRLSRVIFTPQLKGQFYLFCFSIFSDTDKIMSLCNLCVRKNR